MELISHPLNTKLNWIDYASDEQFGDKQLIKSTKIKDNYNILGIMSELLIWRLQNKNVLSAQILYNTNSIIYTNDTQYISCMRDIKLMSYETFCQKQIKLLNANKVLKDKIAKAYKNKMIVIHSNFNTIHIKEDVKQFLSDTKNKKLSTKCIWNTTLYYIHCTFGEYNPLVPELIDLFDEDISILHNNIKIYYDKYIKGIKKIGFEIDFHVSASNFPPTQLEELNIDNRHLVSISGRCDIYNYDDNTMIEIKTSTFNECSDQWIIQTLCYVMLMNEIHKIKIKKMKIVNMLNGFIWSWKLPILPSIEEFIETISKKYKWHIFERDALLASIHKNKKI